MEQKQKNATTIFSQIPHFRALRLINHSSEVKTEIYNIINKCKKKMQENKTKAAPLYFLKGNILLAITIVPFGML